MRITDIPHGEHDELADIERETPTLRTVLKDVFAAWAMDDNARVRHGAKRVLAAIVRLERGADPD